MREGRGSRVIDTHNHILHAQASLLGNAALCDLSKSERERERGRERESERILDRNQLSGVARKVHINKMRAKCQQKHRSEETIRRGVAAAKTMRHSMWHAAWRVAL